MRTLKNYRFTDETIQQIDDLQKASGKTATDILEALVQLAHDELEAAQAGEEHDVVLIARIVGKRVKTKMPASLVKTAS